MSPNPQTLALFLLTFFLFHFSSGLPDPDPLTIQPFLLNPSLPSTIPAFPEQSDVQACPLNLPDELFHGIKTACGGAKKGDRLMTGELHRTRCCPVLAAWLYAAYSATALDRAGRVSTSAAVVADMPVLPDDSETCVSNLGKALSERGIELIKPNETCDVVYCYCGIRLHPLSCPEAFSSNQKGKLVGDEKVKRLERDCLSNGVNGGGLGGCSKCLHSLHQLDKEKTWNSSKEENRTKKMHNKVCELMGVTWLLAKNRKAYIHTVSSVLRATMMSTDGSDPRSCTVNSDGMPLAVDSSQISDASSSSPISLPLLLSLLACFLYKHNLEGF